MGYCEECEEKAYKIMKFLLNFYDMEWWCDHAITQRVCDGCGQTIINILSNVAGKNDDIEETHAITCENCGYVNHITVSGVLLKVVQTAKEGVIND